MLALTTKSRTGILALISTLSGERVDASICQSAARASHKPAADANSSRWYLSRRAMSRHFRRMVRFLRRRICGQGRALTFMGVAETFVALNRGPRVAPMDI